MCDVRRTKSRHSNIVVVPSTKNKANTIYCDVFSKWRIREQLEDIKGVNLRGTDNTMNKRKNRQTTGNQRSTKHYIEN